MNTSTQKTTTTFLSENKKGLVVLLVLFLLSSMGMCGQTKTEVAPVVSVTLQEVSKDGVHEVALDSDVDFMNWFMGSRQTQSVQENTGNSSTNPSRKKQIISSGVIPNKVLYRTFIKRVISQESAIV